MAEQLVESANMPPSPGLTNNSLRQVVRVSIGGDTLRVKFSNKFSATGYKLMADSIDLNLFVQSTATVKGAAERGG